MAADLPSGPARPRLAAIVFRIRRSRRNGLHQLAARTRIPFSALVREAVADLLRKHGALP